MSLKIAARAKRAARGAAPSPFSLAARLTVWYAASAFALVLLATGVLYAALVINMDRIDDEFLHNEVHLIRSLLREKPENFETLQQEVEDESEVYVRLLNDQGQLVAEAQGMDEAVAPADFPRPVEVELPLGKGIDFRSTSGRLFRTLSARTTAADGHGPYIVQVAVDRTHEADTLATYRKYLWGTLIATLVLSSLGGYRIARRGIRPVQEITALAHRIRSTTLDKRLESAHLPAELASLADIFNEMLDRLEESFGRLSRFSDDIAHELRTPVNNLRGEAEVALSKPRSADEYRDVLGSCLEESQRLSRTIDALLLLARTENPQTHISRERVDVSRELAALGDYYEIPAAEAGIALVVVAPPPLAAELNRPLFQRAVGNLVENALAHTPRGGHIEISAAQDNGSLRVEVADTGCGIAEEHLARVFDRFYRVDPARSAHGGGVGLGLAIVKSIATLHGGTVELHSAPGQGTRIALLFPAPLPASSSDLVGASAS